MSEKITIEKRREFRDEDYALVVMKILREKPTGKIILNVSQGTVCSVEAVSEMPAPAVAGNGRNHTSKNVLDNFQ